MLRVGKDSDACETQPMIPLNFLCHGSPSNYWAHVPGPSGMGNPSLYLKKNLHIQANITEKILPCKDKSTYSEAVASSCIFFSTDQKKKRKKEKLHSSKAVPLIFKDCYLRPSSLSFSSTAVFPQASRLHFLIEIQTFS